MRLAWALPAALLAWLAGGAARAQVSTVGDIDYSTSLTSLPSNSSVSTADFGTSSTTGLVSNATVDVGSGTEAATITFSGTSGIYNGSVSGVVAAPYIATGVQASNYIAAEPGGGVTITYAAPQQYFGLLWGSVDTYNTLTFYNGSQEVGQLTGTEIAANANGNQGAAGSYYVNANFNGVTYNRVVATSGDPAFEFGLITASQTKQVIAPAPFGLPGGTPAGCLVLLAGAGMLFRRRVGG